MLKEFHTTVKQVGLIDPFKSNTFKSICIFKVTCKYA